MMDGTNNNDNNVGSSGSTPPFGKGSIVLTPRNWIARVNWIHQSDMKVGVSYLELPSAGNVFRVEELKLLCPTADPPYFDDISEDRIAEERRMYEWEQGEIKRFKATKAKKEKPFEEKLAEALLAKHTPEEIEEMLKK